MNTRTDYEILTTKDADLWNRYLEQIPIEQKDIYYTPKYYKLYEDLGDGIAQCYVFKSNHDIALYPFLKNSTNDLGFYLPDQFFDIQGAYGYNGVISSNYNKEFIANFYNSFSKYCLGENIIAEFTRFHPLIHNQLFSQNYLTVLLDRYTVVIDLKIDPEVVWNNEYSSSNRNMIRKAQKLEYSGQVFANPSIDLIDQFISIYNNSMKKASAEPYYYFNRTFFLKSFEYLKGRSFLINILDQNNQCICSGIFLKHGDYFHYHLSGRSYLADNSVNNFLLHYAYQFALKTGARSFHLGGGRSTAPDDSLLKFKRSFSRNLLPFHIGKKIHNPKIYNDLINQWEVKFPEKTYKCRNLLLKYRY